MEIDFEHHFGAVERSVTSAERDGQPAHELMLSRVFLATLDDLWDAGTSRERVPRWFLPLSGELELGGRFQLEGHAGGLITACEPLSHLALTWEFGGDVSWVEARLTDEGAGNARLTLTHASRPSNHWDTFGPGAVGVGWELIMMGLALHIAQPDATMPDPEEFATWPDARAFIARSSEAWGEAAIAAGAAPDAARAAATRTTAFYTGESSETG